LKHRDRAAPGDQRDPGLKRHYADRKQSAGLKQCIAGSDPRVGLVFLEWIESNGRRESGAPFVRGLKASDHGADAPL
jgi:hypothetical protein